MYDNNQMITWVAKDYFPNEKDIDSLHYLQTAPLTFSFSASLGQKINIVSLNADIFHCITEDHSVFSWGDDFSHYGVLGNNAQVYKIESPTRNDCLTNLGISLIKSSEFSCAGKDRRNNLYAWGQHIGNKPLLIAENCQLFAVSAEFIVFNNDTTVYFYTVKTKKSNSCDITASLSKISCGKDIVVAMSEMKKIYIFNSEGINLVKLDDNTRIVDYQIANNDLIFFTDEKVIVNLKYGHTRTGNFSLQNYTQTNYEFYTDISNVEGEWTSDCFFFEVECDERKKRSFEQGKDMLKAIFRKRRSIFEAVDSKSFNFGNIFKRTQNNKVFFSEDTRKFASKFKLDMIEEIQKGYSKFNKGDSEVWTNYNKFKTDQDQKSNAEQGGLRTLDSNKQTIGRNGWPSYNTISTISQKGMGSDYQNSKSILTSKTATGELGKVFNDKTTPTLTTTLLNSDLQDSQLKKPLRKGNLEIETESNNLKPSRRVVKKIQHRNSAPHSLFAFKGNNELLNSVNSKEQGKEEESGRKKRKKISVFISDDKIKSIEVKVLSQLSDETMRRSFKSSGQKKSEKSSKTDLLVESESKKRMVIKNVSSPKMAQPSSRESVNDLKYRTASISENNESESEKTSNISGKKKEKKHKKISFHQSVDENISRKSTMEKKMQASKKSSSKTQSSCKEESENEKQSEESRRSKKSKGKPYKNENEKEKENENEKSDPAEARAILKGKVSKRNLKRSIDNSKNINIVSVNSDEGNSSIENSLLRGNKIITDERYKMSPVASTIETQIENMTPKKMMGSKENFESNQIEKRLQKKTRNVLSPSTPNSKKKSCIVSKTQGSQRDINQELIEVNDDSLSNSNYYKSSTISYGPQSMKGLKVSTSTLKGSQGLRSSQPRTNSSTCASLKHSGLTMSQLRPNPTGLRSPSTPSLVSTRLKPIIQVKTKDDLINLLTESRSLRNSNYFYVEENDQIYNVTSKDDNVNQVTEILTSGISDRGNRKTIRPKDIKAIDRFGRRKKLTSKGENGDIMSRLYAKFKRYTNMNSRFDMWYYRTRADVQVIPKERTGSNSKDKYGLVCHVKGKDENPTLRSSLRLSPVKNCKSCEKYAETLNNTIRTSPTPFQGLDSKKNLIHISTFDEKDRTPYSPIELDDANQSPFKTSRFKGS